MRGYGRSELSRKQAFQLSDRDVGGGGKGLAFNRFAEIFFHRRQRPHESAAGDAVALPWCCALRAASLTLFRLNIPIADPARQASAKLLRNQRDGEIKACQPASAGYPVAVDYEKTALKQRGRESFKKSRLMFPVNGAAVAIEKSRPG